MRASPFIWCLDFCQSSPGELPLVRLLRILKYSYGIGPAFRLSSLGQHQSFLQSTALWPSASQLNFLFRSVLFLHAKSFFLPFFEEKNGLWFVCFIPKPCNHANKVLNAVPKKLFNCLKIFRNRRFRSMKDSTKCVCEKL